MGFYSHQNYKLSPCIAERLFLCFLLLLKHFCRVWRRQRSLTFNVEARRCHKFSRNCRNCAITVCFFCSSFRILEVARCSQLTDVGFTTLARVSVAARYSQTETQQSWNSHWNHQQRHAKFSHDHFWLVLFFFFPNKMHHIFCSSRAVTLRKCWS